MVGVITTQGTVLKGRGVRKVENHWSHSFPSVITVPVALFTAPLLTLAIAS